MEHMVALANPTKTSTYDSFAAFEKPHSRVRGKVAHQLHRDVPRKSLSRIEIRLSFLKSHVRLESFTRDPIGYWGEDFDLYEYVGSNSIVYVDPLGNFRVRPGDDDDREHTKNKRKSTKEKHEKGRTTAKKNRGGEKGDDRRRGNPNKRGGRKGGLGGVVGIWLCLEGTACAADPPNDWRDPRFNTNCECNCECTQFSVVEIVPDFWNLAGVPETFSPVKVGDYSAGATSIGGCQAEEGVDDVDVTYRLGYTIYNTTYTVCGWGGSTFGIPRLDPANKDCFCDPCGTSSAAY